MKFAYIILGRDFNPEIDRASIHDGCVQLVGVSSFEEACTQALRLKNEGVDCIELCGAFGPKGAEQVIAAVENSLPVGYAVHLPIQDDIFKKVFGE